MTDIQIYAGTLTASEADRSATGLLVPYDEECSSNLGRFKVDSGAFAIPADLTGAGLNVEHEREQVVGAVTKLTETPKGIVATFSFANTEEGEKALQDALSGKRKNLSAEVADVVIRAGKAISGRIFGAAVVKSGAFPSATLLAAAADTEEAAPQQPEATVTDGKKVDEFTDESGKKFKRTITTTTRTEPDGDGGTKTTITEKTVLEEPDTAPTEEENPVGDAQVPNTLTAGKPATKTERKEVNLPTLFAAMNRARIHQASTEDMTLLAASSMKLGGSPEQIAQTLLAALSDIKISGSGSLPVGGSAIQPNWVGQLDQGITYERQFVPLAKTGTNITAEGKKGFKVHRGTVGSPVDSYANSDWAGNKADIATGTGFTDPFTSKLHRFAWGADIAREYIDLPGGAEVLAAFFSLIKEDHLVWSDEKARLAWIALAGAPIAPATYPDGYPSALGVVMQAIRAVQKPKADKRRDKVSFVIVNDEAADAIAYTPFEKIPEFIKFGWSLTENGGTVEDGDIVLVNGDNGITGSPAALAGADYALELDELAGGPLWIDALHVAQGGVDKAIHGYLQEFQVRPEAVEVVGTPAARANSTAYPVGRIIKQSSTVYRVTAAGTSDSSAPTAPAVNATVTDGTATLLRVA